MAVSPTALTISEGGAETYKVRLAARIGRARTVNLSSGNPDVTVDADPYTAGIQTSLTFTAANWNTEQTVTVTAGQDDDADDDSATISLTGDGVESGSVEVTVTDDDGTSGFNLSALWPEKGQGSAEHPLDRRRPEEQPHRIPRDRFVSLGFDHRRRHPTASA